MKIKKIVSALLCLCLVMGVLAGCASKKPLDPKKPVTITFWHTYGQQMNTSIGALTDEFNDTIGKERGTTVQINYIADASEVNERLMQTAHGDPGAPEFPDIAVIYPSIAIALAQMGFLTDLSTYFNTDELSKYVPEFLEEGRLGGGTLYLLPIAKSTEVLYVNATLFDRFAADTGVSYYQLVTFEGLCEAAELYYEWSDGKSFFYSESLFNTAMVGFEQLGDDFLAGSKLNLTSPTFHRIWDAYYPPAVTGGNAIFDNYSNYLMASGEIVCCTSTTASVTFFPETVIFLDNTQEDLELTVLPYPVFEGGRKVALQRGGGLCVFKSDEKKEYAAAVFLKWLTEPEQNLRFTTRTGYLPVTTAAFGGAMDKELENVTEENVRKLFDTVGGMQGEYRFFVPPVFDGLDEMQREYNRSLRRVADTSREEFLALLGSQGSQAAYETVSRGVFDRFISNR